MLKSIIATIFLLSFALQTCGSLLVVIDYFTNTAAFAKDCENKAKPKLHCNGKCQMIKKLQQSAQKDQQNPERKPDNKNETILYFPASFACITSSIQDKANTFNTHSSSGRLLQMPHTVFHPPGA